MKERPILFSSPMVRAILAGTKTQTRRAIKGPPYQRVYWNPVMVNGYAGWVCEHGWPVRCPYGQSGDRLWVRETYFAPPRPRTDVLGYNADDDYPHGMAYRVIPSIHMPRAASRITLEITGVRVERLQDISEQDIWAEGWRAIADIPDENGGRCKYRSFGEFWESINGPGSWERNPWVWVIEFLRVEK